MKQALSNLWNWLKGAPPPGDAEPYERPPEHPATPREIYLLCATLHFAASVLLPILYFSIGGVPSEYSVGGVRTEATGGNAGMPAEVGFLLFHLIQLLQWPMSWFMLGLSRLAGGAMMTGWLSYFPVALNSLLCAYPIYLLVMSIRRWRGARQP